LNGRIEHGKSAEGIVSTWSQNCDMRSPQLFKEYWIESELYGLKRNEKLFLYLLTIYFCFNVPWYKHICLTILTCETLRIKEKQNECLKMSSKQSACFAATIIKFPSHSCIMSS